ncbi:MAG: hypothetical protein AB7E61_06435 [Acholeplasmataceae bacterium]
MRYNQSIYLIKTSNQQDPISGLKTKVMTSYKKVIAGASPVGAYTNWNAHSQNVELTAVFQIRSMVYGNEKLLYARDLSGEYKLFEINSIAKGERSDLFRLNCVDSNQTNIKEAIENELSN